MSDRQVTKEQYTAFLCDLEEISRKHGIVIGGCGCCGSPFMNAMGRKTEGQCCYASFMNGSDIKWMTKTEAEDLEIRNQSSGLADPVMLRSDRR